MSAQHLHDICTSLIDELNASKQFKVLMWVGDGFDDDVLHQAFRSSVCNAQFAATEPMELAFYSFEAAVMYLTALRTEMRHHEHLLIKGKALTA